MSEVVYERPKAIIVCDYDEPDPYSYRGVKVISVTNPEEKEKTFSSKSPLRDKNAAIEYAKLLGARVSVSSSWDNFLSDAAMEIIRLSGLPLSEEDWDKILFSDAGE